MSTFTERDAGASTELRRADKLLLTTHENPDGDALGSLLGDARCPRAARQGLGDVHVAATEFPLPYEYRHMPLDDVLHEPPADLAERTVVFLDCGNIDRMPVDFLQDDGMHILNIDHHHDNTRFGDGEPGLRARVLHGRDRLRPRQGAGRGDHQGASPRRSTSGWSPTPASSCSTNTDAAAHTMAAELIEAGVDAARDPPRLYEGLPVRRLQLLARALARVRALRRRRR